MALELPAGARRIVDLGCGPGSSTRQLPPGAIGGDYALSMLRRARRRAPEMPLLCLDAASLPLRTASQHRNIKLREIAEQVVYLGDLDD